MARYTIIVSTMDFASINIRDKLFHIGLWERARGNDRFRVYRQGQFMLVETDDYHVFHDGIDRELEAMGYKPDAIIFASKHRSKDGRKTLTVHHTGNFGEARFGGRSHELATAAPRVALSLLKNLKFRATGYDISYEATHHGPSDLVTPSVYVEIGSSETEWKDAGAGEAVARAILDIKEDADAPVYLGIGGNHYAPRETALSLEAGTAFGHIIADHAIPLLTGETLAQAFERSGTRIAYIDRKSIPADERRRIEGLLASSGFEAHTESYIRDVALNPVLKCHRLRDLMVWRKLSRPQVSEKLRESAPRCGSGRCDACPIWAATEINGELLAFSYKLDRDSVLKIFSGAPVIYFLDNTGRPASLVVGMDRQSLDRATAWITERCVEILKTRHKIKYDPIEGMLYVIERR
ncbi:MAG TPA: D-aminoacyl-tRNA deacylase, partial [Methanocella sp.]|nr:D-aminoacyl-tRNA deacylase [Methanocella sp.]